MKRFCGPAIGGVRFEWALEHAERSSLPARSDARNVTVRSPGHSAETDFVILTHWHIADVLASSCGSKIHNSVVTFVAIDVIQIVLWPRFVSDEPRETMGAVQALVQLNLYVPSPIRRSSNSAPPRLATHCLFPAKYASFCVVVQQVQDHFRC